MSHSPKHPDLPSVLLLYISDRNRFSQCSCRRCDRYDYLTVFVSRPRPSLSGLGVTLTQHTSRFIMNALAHLSACSQALS